jgi:hypothetical protein
MVTARVTLVRTAMSAGADLRIGDLPFKGHERLFRCFPASQSPVVRRCPQ